MQLLLNREGNLSIFRIGVIFGILGIFGIAFGFLSLQFEISNRQQPFNITLFPNATELGRQQNPLRQTGQLVHYLVSGVSVEDVAAFYQTELDKHLGQTGSTQNRQQCVRTPPVGNYQNYQEGTGQIPYYYDCLFDNTFLDNTQITKVRIHPGVRDDVRNINYEGNVVIIYDQIWSRP